MAHIISARLRHFAGLLVPRAWRHLLDGLPGLKIFDAEGYPEEALYKGRPILKFSKINDIHSPRTGRLFIIGSGPSIDLMDFSKIDLRNCILLNGAINLLSDDLPFAIAIEDERFVDRHFSLIRSKINKDTVCLLSVSVIRRICEFDPDWLFDKKTILIDNILKPYNRKRTSLRQLSGEKKIQVEEATGVGFSECAEKGVFQAGSVVVTAVQFAFHWRPREISLLGIDITNADEPRFYETKNSMAFSGIVKGRTRICRSLIFAGWFCRLRGVELVNYSPISFLRHTSIRFSDQLVRSSE